MLIARVKDNILHENDDYPVVVTLEHDDCSYNVKTVFRVYDMVSVELR